MCLAGVRCAAVSRPFTIEHDGDELEKEQWRFWAQRRFPSYETFWAARIVPLTYRVRDRSNIRFQTPAELTLSGHSDEDVAVAQLHYTLLVHLGRVFALLDDARALTDPSPRANRPFGRDQFFESFARLSGASDVADELLARCERPATYDAWNEAHGNAARRSWRESHPDPLHRVRAYRNRLVHGRVVPETYVDALDPQGRPVGSLLLYPVLGSVDAYLDWRVAFAAAAAPSPDFAEAALVAADAWNEVVAYVETAWQTHLFPQTENSGSAAGAGEPCS
jgi:hypothetical protein